MSGIYVVYCSDTGAIRKQITGMLNPCDWDPATQGYIELPTFETIVDRVVDLASLSLVPIGDLPYTTTGRAVADAKTEYILALPEGTIYDNQVVEDNSLEFTFDEPGPFVIKLTNPLYSPLALTIDVEAT
jgi:hypothetical protein